MRRVTLAKLICWMSGCNSGLFFGGGGDLKNWLTYVHGNGRLAGDV